MQHIPIIIVDLAFILIVAGVISITFKSIKQPVVLGYLIAGLLVGPHVPFIPTVQDITNVKVWAEIGVIFLLFSLGLEFSFKKLAKVGKTATITAIFEIVFMIFLGYWVGRLLNWSRIDSLFLGGILSISSTTIIVKSFEELNLKTKKFVSVVFGVLIVEDIVAILLLVLLSTVAITQYFSGIELLSSITRLAFFLILWFIIGIYLIPTLLRSFEKHLNKESLLIISLGFCLSMVLIAVYSGFSAALGAFVMGSILAETSEGKNIEKLFHPVKDLFAAIFFVSVGMMINPQIIYEHWQVILLITIITIVGKFLSSTLGALISGESLKNSVIAGLSLAQIGEFSFIIATLGLNLGVTSDFLYPLAVAVSVITTFTTPIAIKHSERIHHKIESILSSKILNSLEKYRSTVNQQNQYGIIYFFLKSISGIIIINSVIIIGITIVCKTIIYRYLNTYFKSSDLSQYISITINFLICLPLFWAILFALPQKSKKTFLETLKSHKIHYLFFFIRIITFVLLVYFCLQQYSSKSAALFLVLAIFLLAISLLNNRIEVLYRKLEDFFLFNLQSQESLIKEKDIKIVLPMWEATIIQLVAHHGSPFLNKPLYELRFKEDYSVIIVQVLRGADKIYSPDKNFKIQHGDIISIVGNEDEVEKIRLLFEKSYLSKESSHEEVFGVESLIIQSGSPFENINIRKCNFKKLINGLVVGIERNEKNILTPPSDFVLKKGDVLWVFGELKKIKTIKFYP